MPKPGENLQPIVVVACCLIASGPEAQFGRFLSFRKVESDVTRYCQVLRTFVPSDAAVVFAESDIQNPVRSVYNAPMGAHCSINLALLTRLEMK